MDHVKQREMDLMNTHAIYLLKLYRIWTDLLGAHGVGGRFLRGYN